MTDKDTITNERLVGLLSDIADRLQLLESDVAQMKGEARRPEYRLEYQRHRRAFQEHLQKAREPGAPKIHCVQNRKQLPGHAMLESEQDKVDTPAYP